MKGLYKSNCLRLSILLLTKLIYIHIYIFRSIKMLRVAPRPMTLIFLHGPISDAGKRYFYGKNKVSILIYI